MKLIFAVIFFAGSLFALIADDRVTWAIFLVAYAYFITLHTDNRKEK